MKKNKTALLFFFFCDSTSEPSTFAWKVRMETCTGVEVVSLRGDWANEAAAAYLGGTGKKTMIVSGRRLARKGRFSSNAVSSGKKKGGDAMNGDCRAGRGAALS